VGFWKEIQGDWMPGTTWKNSMGAETSDVGGNLMGILNEKGIAWRPLLRSHSLAEHLLWFGIYGGVAYHHGAGFRPAVSRMELWSRHPRIWKGYQQLQRLPNTRVTRALRRLLSPKQLGAVKIAEKNQQTSRELLTRMLENDAFFDAYQKEFTC
jgi:hypothetical protein